MNEENKEQRTEEEKKAALHLAMMDAFHLAYKHRGRMVKSCDNYVSKMFEPLFD